ncbi:2-ketoisovalerate ferredoxin oxidoreductase [candidate division LCP-89 bacterium B3_LCP]|uniref:2-ketoisovalerate ferredoxin oxidoreductase n=1 Tax=candidate division LCP-89 bacterium B3_LCP TaxID=2012998 RepID=A0A532UYU5_UNCL8|nr:MAG: 2-ketoisovalerate ferredoxin oxidoreductase [candidate division LCP-89 bacterium B3_LCP]
MSPQIPGQITYDIPQQEIMSSGHLACPGCGASLCMRIALKIFGPRTVLCVPACCWAVIDGPFPYSAAGVPVVHCAFETAAITATGVRHGLDIRGIKDCTVVAWAGDGGTFDIGFGALSATVERNENIAYVCYDNEAYMNTGIQRSSATPIGAWTSTTPGEHPKEEPKKNLVEIMAAHRIPYVATATVAFMDDLTRKLKRIRDMEGTRLLHIFSPCPPGHKSLESDSIKISRLAVETKVFPLYEIENGLKYTLNHKPKGIPVQEYTRLQGRFKHLTEEDLKQMQQRVDYEWDVLDKRISLFA